MTLDEILQAKQFSDLFPNGTKKELRTLLKTAHPDLHPGNEDKAAKAFMLINSLWTHKTVDPPTAAKATTGIPNDTIISKKHEYKIKRIIRNANGVTTFSASYDAGHENVMIQLATHPKVGTELIEGARHLKHIRTEIPADYLDFYPETIDVFHLKQDNDKLSGIVIPSPAKFYTLQEVKEDYPDGIDGRDVAWMYRRMLVAIGNAHDSGIAHGAPDEAAFLIHPETHGLWLTNWQYSQELGRDVHMVNAFTKSFYETDKATSIRTDLRIATKTALNLLDYRSPKQLRYGLSGFFNYPPATARDALAEFDDLLKNVYGASSFHEFKMKRNK